MTSGLAQYLADVASMRGFVSAEDVPDGKYDAAENYGMDHPYGYSEEDDG